MIAPTTQAQAVADLLDAAPPGQGKLSDRSVRALRVATARLVDADGSAGREEYARFLAISSRSIAVDQAHLRQVHVGRVVLITGGTGCIGSEVVQQVCGLAPARVISVSRGLQTGWPRYAGVEYVELDIRDCEALAELVRRERPDIVYHLAAQHDPGLAEVEVERTLSTNVGGTINVVEACKLLPTVRLACASTGKALRPFSRDIYCASKKMAEWVLGEAAALTSMRISAVRFTHVVNNSIILQRLQDWTATGETVRLHSLDTMFYLQSAREAAQLLMSSVLDAGPGRLAVGAIRDLGWPVSLLDLSVGMVAAHPTASAIYCCGTEAGYESAPYPGLYDPKVSGLISPLFNALEALSVSGSSSSDDIDVLHSSVRSHPQIRRLIRETVNHATAGATAGTLREQVAHCGWAMLAAFLAQVRPEVISRHVTMLGGKSQAAFSADDLTTQAMVHKQRERYRHVRNGSGLPVPLQPVGSPVVGLPSR